jgi:hypothetical protein
LLRCQSLAPASEGLSAVAAARRHSRRAQFMLKYILLSNYIALAMRQADKYTLNVRRENLLKAIRSQQR